MPLRLLALLLHMQALLPMRLRRRLQIPATEKVE
jgi:hypothetical protein